MTRLLTDRTLTCGDGATQVFRTRGATCCDKGHPSTGRWAVSEDQYCSVWPPSGSWARSGVTQSGDGMTITLVAADESTTVGQLARWQRP